MGPKKKQRTEGGDTDGGSVDPHSGLTDSGTVHSSEGHIWSAELSQRDEAKNSDKFYVIQLIEDSSGTPHVFTRFGRAGAVGQKNTEVCGSTAAAKAVFRKKYKEKTGTLWDAGTFKAVAGKYKLVSRGGAAVDGGDTEEDDDDEDADDSSSDDGGGKVASKKKKVPKKKAAEVPEAFGEFAGPLITAVSNKPNWKQKIEKDKIVSTWRKEYVNIVKGLLPAHSADKIFELAIELLKKLAERDDDDDDDDDPHMAEPHNWALQLSFPSEDVGIPCECDCVACEDGHFPTPEDIEDDIDDYEFHKEYKGKKEPKPYIAWQKARCKCSRDNVARIAERRRQFLNAHTKQVPGLIPADLTSKLTAIAADMESLPAGDLDWHPGSKKKVLDLVHPSLFCYVKGISTLAVPLSSHTGEEDDRRDSVDDEILFSWLPTDFDVTLPKAAASKPEKVVWEWADDAGDWIAFSSADQKVLESQFTKDSVSPFCTKKMSFSTTNSVTFDFPKGIQTNDETKKRRQFRRVVSGGGGSALSKATVKRLGYINNVEGENFANLITDILSYMMPHFETVIDRRLLMKKLDDTHPIDYADSDISNIADEQDRFQLAAEEAIKACGDDRDTFLVHMQQILDKETKKFTEHLRSKVAGWKATAAKHLGPQLPWMLNRRVQVITKMSSVVLSPDQPTYDGGVWHLEGIPQERIIATGIFYYHTDNITDPELSFRVAADDPPIPQEGTDWVKIHYNWEPKENDYNRTFGEAVPVGSCTTKEGLCLFFPNNFQHKLGPMSLINKKKAGSRKILVFFLVDPSTPIVSTTNILNQREGGVMSLAEARAFRELLMHERKYVVKDESAFFERSFSLCEH